MSSHTAQILIVSPGRSGSTLLASILANSGADFALPVEKDWDHRKGAMEHSLCHTAYRQLTRIKKIQDSILPTNVIISRYRKQFDSTVDQLCSIPFLKSSKLVYLVPYIATRGKKVRCIVVYRDFEGYALSRYNKYKWDYIRLETEYYNAYASALLGLAAHGGVVVRYSELMDVTNKHVCRTLAIETGLSYEKILESRQELLKNRTKETKIKSPIYCSESINRLEEKLKELSGE